MVQIEKFRVSLWGRVEVRKKKKNEAFLHLVGSPFLKLQSISKDNKSNIEEPV